MGRYRLAAPIFVAGLRVAARAELYCLPGQKMNSLPKFLQVFALGTWIGSIIYLSFVVAPGAFATLKDTDQAGAMVGYALSRLHFLGLVAGILYLVLGFFLVRGMKDLLQPAMLGVLLMVVLTAVSQGYVTSRMHDLRVKMVSVQATPKDDPSRVEFDRLHGMSVKLEVAVLLLGVVSLFFTVRNPQN
jgi:uncharacterized membrane protein